MKLLERPCLNAFGVFHFLKHTLFVAHDPAQEHSLCLAVMFSNLLKSVVNPQLLTASHLLDTLDHTLLLS